MLDGLLYSNVSTPLIGLRAYLGVVLTSLRYIFVEANCYIWIVKK